VLQKDAFRNPWLYLPALGTEAMAPLLRAWARIRTGPPTPPERWRKGILIGESHIGDVLYNTSSLPRLKEGLPQCDWVYLAEPPASEVLRDNPNLAGVAAFPRPFGRGARDQKTLAWLKAQTFDVALCYNCGMYRRDLALAIRAGIPNRVGYGHKGFSGWVTHPAPFRHRQPYPAYFRDLVAHLTGQPPLGTLRPQVFPDSADEKMADGVRQRLRGTPGLPWLACFVTTRQPSGSWPREAFGRVLQLLQKHWNVVLCGAAGDREILQQVQQSHCPDAEILAGDLPLRALVAFLKHCRACLCADSGPRHLANAAGIPVFFPRNLWFGKEEAGPYLPTEHDFSPPMEHLSHERQAKLLREIPPAPVAEMLRQLAGKNP